MGAGGYQPYILLNKSPLVLFQGGFWLSLQVMLPNYNIGHCLSLI